MNRLFVIALVLLAAFGVQPRAQAKVCVPEKLASGIFELDTASSAPADDAASPDNAGENDSPSYEPVSGLRKWLNEDPIGERGGLNLYGYVGNHPLWGIDPLGLFEPKLGQPSGRGVDLDLHSQGVEGNCNSNPRKAFDDDESFTVMGHGQNRYSDGSLIKDPYIQDQTGYASGDPDGPSVPKLTPEQLAETIMKHPKWPGSKNVVLYSCNTGNGGKKSFAKRLAKLLKVRVYAPTDVLNMSGGSPVSINNNGTFESLDP